MNVTIDEYKKTINSEFNFSESYDGEESLHRSFGIGTILLTPCVKQKQRPWLKKAFDEWNRGGRTILLVTPLRLTCKYFKHYLNNSVEIRVIRTPLMYKQQVILRPMVLAIFKSKPLRELNHLVTFD
jgi:hypothetical protein